MKPIVDGLEHQLRGRATVLRIDLLSRAGREAARRYGVKLIPLLIVFDGDGNVIARQVGVFDPGSIRSAIERSIAARAR
jgi:thioredoxin-related protein